MTEDKLDPFYRIEMFGEYLTLDGNPLNIFGASQAEQIVRALQTDTVKNGMDSDEAHKLIRYIKITG